MDDNSGLVNIIYFSNDQLSGNQTNTYVAYSLDGDNWQNIKVSDQPHSDSPANVNNDFYCNYDLLGLFNEAGNYPGIASFKGRSFAVWCDNRSGYWDLYVSEIDFSGASLFLKSSSYTDYDINDPPPNPPTIYGNNTYQACDILRCSNIDPVSIDANANVYFIAGKEVQLYPGFSTKIGAHFCAQIVDFPCDSCITPVATSNHSQKLKENLEFSSENISNETINGINLFTYPNPANDFITVGCLNNDYNNISISISDLNGNIYYGNQIPDIIDKQEISKIFDVKKFPSGIYVLTIMLDNKKYSVKFVKR